MKPNNQIAGKAAPSTTGALLALFLVAGFTASNYSSSLNTYYQFLASFSATAVRSRGSNAAGASSCDVARGEWVPDPAVPPYYTNTTCPLIGARQNCMKYGKPGLDSILGWRWQPHGCDLPRFDPAAFLRLVRGKSMAFVGDSVARNHMQSLMCLLSKVGFPTEIEPRKCPQCTRKYRYREHNFTLCMFWSPFLVPWTRAAGKQLMPPHSVYLDEPDPEWTRDVAAYDYVVLSAAKWFARPTMLYERGRLIGCGNVDCGTAQSATAVPVAPDYAVRLSFRTALRALAGFRGTVVVRTVAPPHYENGEWDDGGNCLRTRPTLSNETSLPETVAVFHAAQVEEFRAASAAAAGRFVLMDVSEMMQMRGDGHPGQYGHWPHEKVGFGIDCVHWCLPGPIDAWNDLLLHLLSA